jgi:hypothetical protein
MIHFCDANMATVDTRRTELLVFGDILEILLSRGYDTLLGVANMTGAWTQDVQSCLYYSYLATF